jgi:hypothetical protein
VLEKYIEMSRGLRVVQAWYDFGAKDLGILAERAGINLNKADKARGYGADTMNTLFRHQMLSIFQGDEQLDKLSGELLTVMSNQGTTKEGDDLVDAARYCVVGIPWDLTGIEAMQDDSEVKAPPRPMTEQELIEEQIMLRRGIDPRREKHEPGWDEMEREFDEWNDQYGS